MDKFLQDIQPDLGSSRVEEHVIRNAARESQKGVKKGSEAEKMKILKKRISEETETLFFIVHDEAHYAPLKNNLVDKLVNDKAIRSARNVVLLQVSATPYCLVTKNSRVRHKNRLDMYRLVQYDFQLSIIFKSTIHREVEKNSTYYGIGQFVEASNPDNEDLIQGTLTKDEDYEKSIKPETDLQCYIKEVFELCKKSKGQKMKKRGQPTDQSEIEHATRFYGLLLQWIKVSHGKCCNQERKNLLKTTFLHFTLCTL